METTTFFARRFANRTSDTWPSWSAPMVGTRAIVAFLARKVSTARRKTGTVRAIMGLRDIWTQSFGQAGHGDPPWRVAVDLSKRVARAPSDTWVENCRRSPQQFARSIIKLPSVRSMDSRRWAI